MTTWDEWDPPAGDFPEHKVMWTVAGAGVSGRVTNLRFVDFGDGKGRTPELWVVDGDGVEWQCTAGPADLQIKLGALRPRVGDVVSIVLVEVRQLGGGKSKKIFRVQMMRDGKVVDADAPAAAPTAVVPSASASARPFDARHDLPAFGQGLPPAGVVAAHPANGAQAAADAVLEADPFAAFRQP